MARDEPLLRIRVPDSLKAQLEQAKDDNRRSLNAEIRIRLERTFREDEERLKAGVSKGLAFVQTAKSGPAATDQDERFANIEARLNELEQALNLAGDVKTESPSKALLVQARGTGE